jgi:hypothetical protein
MVRVADRPRRFNQPALIFLAVGLLVVGTVAFRIWKQRRQDLPLVAERGRSEGLVALDEGKLDKAHQLLAAAKSAVDSLGGQVEGADDIRQGAAEAAILVDLVPETLETLLDQAGRTEPKAWAARFDNLYKGRCVFFDAAIVAVPGEDGFDRYEIDYHVFNGPGPQPARSARIDLRDFRLFEQAGPKIGDQVLFGARLASFAFDTDSEEWVIRFEPESGVFLSHTRALESLGWHSALSAVAPAREDQP